MKKSAFSMVELSIVLIIIGLLAASVTAGTKIIKQAQLRKVLSEFKGYESAYNIFRATYDALPGDFNEADTYFGANQCENNGGSAATCDGDGDDIIENTDGNDGSVSDTDGEAIKAWRQLELAKLINVSLDGQVYTNGWTMNVGQNIPASSWTASGYSIWSQTDTASVSSATATNNARAVIYLGKAISSSWNYGNSMKPEDAYNLDLKLDDGSPSTGIFRGASLPSADSSGTVAVSCSEATTADNNSTTGLVSANAKTYDLDGTTLACLPAYVIDGIAGVYQ